MESKVTVIVPVYNTEMYLARCIESIIHQTYSHLEIILVNDGSTDNSNTICNAYEDKDSRIYSIYQENKGVSQARNRGLQASTGIYVKFVDSDDALEKDAIQKLVYTMEKNKVDIVIAGMRIQNGVEKVCEDLVPQREGILTQTVFQEQYISLYQKQLVGGPCNALYKLDIIQAKHLAFDTSISYGEDTLFNLSYYKQCVKFYLSQDILYNVYRERSNSLVYKYNPNRVDNVIYFMKKIEDYIGESQPALRQIGIGHVIACIDNKIQGDKESNLMQQIQYMKKILNYMEVQKDLEVLSGHIDFSHKVLQIAYQYHVPVFATICFRIKAKLYRGYHQLKKGIRSRKERYICQK